jgi:ABC-type amino acid transport substrate-binding protein
MPNGRLKKGETMSRPQSIKPRARRAGFAPFATTLSAFMLLLLAGAMPSLAATMDAVQKSGKLVLGYRLDARPFSYRDAQGNAAGYSVALCRKVADDLKAELKRAALNVEFVAVSSEERFKALQQGKIHLLCDPATETLARRSAVSFSIPVFASGTGALVRSDAPARLKQVLSGLRVSGPTWRASAYQTLEKRTFAVVSGTTGERWVTQRRSELGLNVAVIAVKDYATGLQRLAGQEADALFGDRAILLDAAKGGPSAGKVILLDRYFTRETVALGLPRGDEDFRLFVDRSLSRLFRSKEIGPLYEAHFGKPEKGALGFYELIALPE